MNIISITSKYNNSMIPSIIFGDYGWNFIFVDIKNNQCIRDEVVTKAWLKRNNISEYEFANHCWSEYNCMKENNVKCGLISYFTKDDETIYIYANNINVADSYDNIFDF